MGLNVTPALVKSFSPVEWDWANVTSLTPTVWASASTPRLLAAAAGDGSRNYVTGLQIQADALGAATNLWLLDGAVAIASATVATPGVFTSGVHDYKVNDAVVLQGLSGLTVTGVSANQVVYVASVPSATTFTLSLTPGGAGVAVTVTGTATIYRILWQNRHQTTAFPLHTVEFISPLHTAPNAALSAQTSSTTTGTIYVETQGFIADR
jgi:hypothetical protein